MLDHDENRNCESQTVSTTPSSSIPKSADRITQLLDVFAILCAYIFDLLRVLIIGIPFLLHRLFTICWPSKPKDVAGQLALITGGGSGLGREMALQLADRGCNAVIVDVNLEAAEQTCQDLRQKGVSAYAYRVDVSSYEEVQQLFDTVYRDIGPVDLLINNAGLIHFTFLQDSSVQDVHRLIDVNVKGYIWTTKIALQKMKDRRRGHIVAISSLSGVHAFPWAVVYSTSKFAVNGFMAALTEQLRLEGYRDEIHTTCVCPYYIATRKDIVDFLQKPRFELLTTEQTAKIAVNAILRNETMLSIPRIFDFGVRFGQLFPLKVQELIRDIIMKEYELHSNL